MRPRTPQEAENVSSVGFRPKNLVPYRGFGPRGAKSQLSYPPGQLRFPPAAPEGEKSRTLLPPRTDIVKYVLLAAETLQSFGLAAWWCTFLSQPDVFPVKCGGTGFYCRRPFGAYSP